MNQSNGARPQFVQIDRGISQFNHDYYAALGLPIISSPVYIRHVYLSIARLLHPDVYGFSQAEKATATQYLAKLVNPAYNTLMKEDERKAYQSIFKLLAMRLTQKARNVPIHSRIACELMLSPSEGLYERSVSAIAKIQYQSLQKIVEYTGQISELNLVYILYKEGYTYGAPNMPPVLLPINPPPNAPLPNLISREAEPNTTIIRPQNQVSDNSAIASRLKICEIYMSQGDWKSALKDLREILQLDKNNSRCHAMLGIVYKNINQPQMAKVSMMLALKINPQEPLALKYIKELENLNLSQAGSKVQASTANKSTNQQTKKEPIQPPQKRGWLSNLIGWAAPDNPKK
jgi:curved DNA-binding protein CbpA